MPRCLEPQVRLPGRHSVSPPPPPQPAMAQHRQVRLGVGRGGASLDLLLVNARKVLRDQLRPMQQQARGQPALDIGQGVDEPGEQLLAYARDLHPTRAAATCKPPSLRRCGRHSGTPLTRSVPLEGPLARSRSLGAGGAQPGGLLGHGYPLTRPVVSTPQVRGPPPSTLQEAIQILRGAAHLRVLPHGPLRRPASHLGGRCNIPGHGVSGRDSPLTCDARCRPPRFRWRLGSGLIALA